MPDLHSTLSHIEIFFEESRLPWILLGVGATCAYMKLFQKAKRVKERMTHLHHRDEFRTLTDIPNASIPKDNNGSAPIYQIVLTGGPCGGKSSAMDFLSDRLRDLGFDVYCMPEVPTLLLNGGCIYPGVTGDEQKLITFETALVELQLQMEKCFNTISKSTGNPSFILYDRGILDVAAFIPRKLWPVVLNHNALLRDGLLGVLERYDLIIHMTTAADGAVADYKLEDRRKESIPEAIALDSRIRENYEGHPNYHVIDNSTNFSTKLERVFSIVKDLIGH